MNPENLPRAVLRDIRSLEIFAPGDSVCVALSGGADSVCLLRLLLENQDILHISLSAVHINHNLRGDESARDAAFCRALCKRLNVPLQVFSVDVSALAKKKRISTELAARQARYDIFAALPQTWLATAHTATDNLETFLHRLIRGAALHGLCAIPPVNGRYVRPLLHITRDEILAYLSRIGQDYVTDSTNRTDAYTRNRIRAHIVPLLKEQNPCVERIAAHTIDALRRDEDFLRHQTDSAYKQCHISTRRLEGLSSLHPAMQTRCLARFLDEQNISRSGQLLERLRNLLQSGGRWEIKKGLFACVEGNVLELVPVPASPPQKQPLCFGENRLYPEKVLFCRAVRSEALVHEKFTNNCLDYDKITGNAFVSPRLPGAKMRLPGRDFTSSLKKCIQSQFPKSHRNHLYFLIDEAGVFFAEGIGVAARVAPDEKTEHFALVEIRPIHADSPPAQSQKPGSSPISTEKTTT